MGSTEISPACVHRDMSLMAVVWIDGRPIAASCKVRSTNPITIYTAESDFLDFNYPCAVTLLWTSDGRVVRSESNISRADELDIGALLTIDFVKASELDRRRHSRIPATVPVAIRTVPTDPCETPIHLYQGFSKDVSFGGAWVELDDAPKLGTMVEFIARPEGLPTVRMLGVVAHQDTNGIGVAFVEPVIGTRENLNEWINHVA